MRKARREQIWSALPQTPDIAGCDCYGRLVPEAAVLRIRLERQDLPAACLGIG
jgi:hypothetical protein